jgi:alkanesulfonate monooxygenase SsuD/methylene tetrahydromethanopterin reductase-like flavin-dependent oxidoreductase (luciferase family)
MVGSVDEVIENMIATNFAVIGTPDDAIAQIERLQQESGGFGLPAARPQLGVVGRHEEELSSSRAT